MPLYFDIAVNGLTEIEKANDAIMDIGLSTDKVSAAVKSKLERTYSSLDERLSKSLKHVGDTSEQSLQRLEKAVFSVDREFTNVSSKMLAISGDLGSGIRTTAKNTEYLKNAVKDFTAEQQIAYRVSEDYVTSLNKRIKLTKSGMAVEAAAAELALKNAKAEVQLAAETRMGITAESKARDALNKQLEQTQARLTLLNSEEHKHLIALQAQEKAILETQKAVHKKSDGLSRMEKALASARQAVADLESAEAKELAVLQLAAKQQEKANAEYAERERGVSRIREEIEKERKALADLTSEEGKQLQLLKLKKKLTSESIQAELERTLGLQKQRDAIAEAQAKLAHLTSAEGKRLSILQQEIKQQEHSNVETLKRTQALNKLHSAYNYLTSAEGKEAALVKEMITLQEQENVTRARQELGLTRISKELEKARGKLADLESVEAKELATLRLLTKQQENANEEYARKQAGVSRLSQEVQKHRQALADLTTEEGKEIQLLKLQKKLTEEAIKSEHERALGLQKQKSELADLTAKLQQVVSEEGKLTSQLKQKIKYQEQLNTEEQRRVQELAKLESQLARLKDGSDKRAVQLKAEIEATKQLIAEETKLASSIERVTQEKKFHSSAAGKALAVAKAELEQIKQNNQAHAEAAVGIDKHRLEVERLRKEIKFLSTTEGQEFLALKREINERKKQIQSMHAAAGAAGVATTAVKRLTKALDVSGQVTASFRAGMSGMGSHMGIFTSSTILVASAVYGTVSAFKDAITTGADFEARMDRVSAIMDSTGQNAAKLEAHTRSLAETTVFTATEVSDGLLFLGMAGLKTEESLAVLEPTLRLASIGMLDMGTTADIVTNILVGFGLKSDDITKTVANMNSVIDDMATAVTNSNMDIEQLGNAMSYVAPLARDADISLQEVVATLEVLHNTGIKASRAGTAMRTSILSMMAPSTEAIEVLMEYGIQVDDNAGRMRNWTTILKELAEANVTLADVEALVGKRQAAGMKAMIDSARAARVKNDELRMMGLEAYKTESELERLTQQLKENAGASETMREVMEDNLQGDWRKLISAIEEKYLEFYEMNKEEFRYLVQSATDFVKSLSVESIDHFFDRMKSHLEWIIEAIAVIKGASLGASVGQAVGSAIGAVAGPGGVLIGGAVGGVIGGAAGGAGAYWGVNQAEKLVDNITGAPEHVVDFAIQNRIQKYRDLTAEELLATREQLLEAKRSTITAVGEVQKELSKALAIGDDKNADKFNTQIQVMQGKVEELEKSLKAAGRAMDESGLFGSRAELSAEIAATTIKFTEYAKAVNTLKLYYSEDSAQVQSVQQNLISTGERLQKLYANRQAFTKVQVQLEEDLKKKKRDQKNLAIDTLTEYEKQRSELLGQTTDITKLRDVKLEIAEKEGELYTTGKQSLNETKKLTEDLIKLYKQLVGLENSVNNARIKREEKARSERDKAHDVYLSLRAENDAIDYRNEAIERGVLLLDDEEYKRSVKIAQIERELGYNKDKLNDETELAKMSDGEVKTLRETIQHQQASLGLLRQKKTLLSESYRIAKAEADALQGVYSSIESETTSLMARGFSDVQSYFDSIVDSFKSMLARLAYQATMKPIVVSMVATTASGLGFSQAAVASFAEQNGVSAAGGTGGAGTFSTAKGLYDVLNGGFTGAGAGVGTLSGKFALSGIGESLGLSAGGTVTQSGGQLIANSTKFGSYAAGIGAGLTLGSGISGKYQTFGNSDVAVTVGTAIGSAFGPVGAAIGGALGGVFNRAFGNAPEQLESEYFKGTLSAGGADVRTVTNTVSKGGWFSSDNRRTYTETATGEMLTALNNSLTGMTTSTKHYLELLDMSTSAVDRFSQSISISLKGLSQAQRQQTLTDALTDWGDALVKSTARGITQFSREGETASQTLARIATHLDLVNTAFGTLGHTLYDVGMLGGNLASDLVQKFGGDQAFTSATSSYYNNFYSAEEKFDQLGSTLAQAASDLGHTLPNSKEGFRELIEAIDLTSESGRTAYSVLVSLNQSASDYYDLLNSQVGDLATAYEQAFKTAPDASLLDSWSDALASGQKTITEMATDVEALITAQQELVEQFTSASNGLYDAYQYTLDIANEEYRLAVERIKLESDFVATLRGTVDSLKLSNLSPLTPDQRLEEAKLSYLSNLDKINSGDLTAAGSLTSSANAYLTEASTYYSSSQQYVDLFNSITATLESLVGTYDTGESAEDRLAQANESLVNIQQNAADTLLRSLELEAENLDAVRGLSGLMATLPQDLANNISQIIGPVPELQANGSHRAGLDYVPYDGYRAELHRGEKVVRANSGAEGNSAVLVEELRAVRKELEDLRQDQREHTQNLVQSYYGASDSAAEKTAEAVEAAAENAVWTTDSKVVLT